MVFIEVQSSKTNGGVSNQSHSGDPKRDQLGKGFHGVVTYI